MGLIIVLSYLMTYLYYYIDRILQKYKILILYKLFAIYKDCSILILI
jgi:hypothetical protein